MNPIMSNPLTRHVTVGYLEDLPEEVIPATWAVGLRQDEVRFIREYLVDLDIKSAAERARVRPTAARSRAVAKEYYDRLVQQIRHAVVAKTGITESRILEEMAAIAFHDPGEYFDVSDEGNLSLQPTAGMSARQRAAIKKVKQTTGKVESVEIELYDKVAALRTLGQAVGMFASETSAKLRTGKRDAEGNEEVTEFTFKISGPGVNTGGS